MNRHHPYGDSGPRRAGPSGPGPDRYHRFPERGSSTPRRGGGRGRGGPYGSPGYNSNMDYNSYDQGPPRPDVDPMYNTYDDPNQDPYYQGGRYDSGGPPYPPPEYDQGYVKYEDGPSPYENGGYGRSRPPDDTGGYGRRRPDENGTYDSGRNQSRRPPRKERDERVREAIIEERINRERPCRVLFIRNIKYETNSADVRRQFEEFGDIKTFFDIISTRGMVFVTYFDLRAAERARERMQGTEMGGRPIDVHYSLPRDDRGGEDKNSELEGALIVQLVNSTTNALIDDNEVRRKFQQFGDVKSVSLATDLPNARFVEFYDTRACEEAYDRLRHQGLQDGVMEISFASNNSDPPPPRTRDSNRYAEDRGGRSGRGARGGGGKNRGRGRSRGGPDDDYERRGNDYGRDRGRDTRPEDDYYRGRGYPDRYDDDAYRGGPPPGRRTPPYAPPPTVTAPPPQDGLDHARRVQDLLAALKPGQSDAPPLQPPVSSMPFAVGSSVPGPGAYYPPPASASQPPYPYTVPAANPAASLSGLPPHLMGLLQSVQQQQAQAQAGPYMGHPGVPSAGTNMEQLMSFLQSAASSNGKPL